VGTTSFRLRYDIERVDQAGKPAQPGETAQAGTRCAQVTITYVCVEVDGRSKSPIPGGLREALVKDQA
jgi:acyl-CoA thioesterase FadM